MLQIVNVGPDRSCTIAHETQHARDYYARYGAALCIGVPNGTLPTGGPNFDAFLKLSECKAFKVGKACRERLQRTCPPADRPIINAGIDRDNEEIDDNC